MKEDRNYEAETVTAPMNATKEMMKDVPSVRLTPEQIEEIHADEYSLLLFYATRMQPMSLSEIKIRFVEKETKKAESVLDRFIKAGLVYKDEEEKCIHIYE